MLKMLRFEPIFGTKNIRKFDRTFKKHGKKNRTTFLVFYFEPK